MVIMKYQNEIEYLYDTAKELRYLAASEPQIAHDLRAMAEELEEMAARFKSPDTRVKVPLWRRRT
jgi:hypothetical protein